MTDKLAQDVIDAMNVHDTTLGALSREARITRIAAWQLVHHGRIRQQDRSRLVAWLTSHDPCPTGMMPVTTVCGPGRLVFQPDTRS